MYRGSAALLAAVTIGPGLSVGRAAEPADPADPISPAFAGADLDFFEEHVRPVFVKRCHACHSADAADIRSGLRIDDHAALLVGGDGGVAVEPGHPETGARRTSTVATTTRN
ncbi:MAG: hypothetical protein EBR86_10685 [Planctomycetia bacterium]|nr:hypothetical protein [Planctomycetia bacterium]